MGAGEAAAVQTSEKEAMTPEEIWEKVEPAAWEFLRTFAEEAARELPYIEIAEPRKLAWPTGRGYVLDLVSLRRRKKRYMARAMLKAMQHPIASGAGLLKWDLAITNPSIYVIAERSRSMMGWTPEEIGSTLGDLESEWRQYDLDRFRKHLPSAVLSVKEWAPHTKRWWEEA